MYTRGRRVCDGGEYRREGGKRSEYLVLFRNAEEVYWSYLSVFVGVDVQACYYELKYLDDDQRILTCKTIQEARDSHACIEGMGGVSSSFSMCGLLVTMILFTPGKMRCAAREPLMRHINPFALANLNGLSTRDQE